MIGNQRLIYVMQIANNLMINFQEFLNQKADNVICDLPLFEILETGPLISFEIIIFSLPLFLANPL